MEKSSTRSKRTSLRFSVPGYRLRYKTEFEDGEALLVNISQGGCALEALTQRVVLHQKVLLILQFNEEMVEIGGIVIRQVDSAAAVRFTSISEKTGGKLVRFFAQWQRSVKEP